MIGEIAIDGIIFKIGGGRHRVLRDVHLFGHANFNIRPKPPRIQKQSGA
jgi:hypothetical protein